MKKVIIGFLAFVILLCGLSIFLDQGPKPNVPKFVAADYIVLRAHTYWMPRRGESGDAFRSRVTAHAAKLMGEFESVTINYYVNVNGEEQAIIVSEKKVWKR